MNQIIAFAIVALILAYIFVVFGLGYGGGDRRKSNGWDRYGGWDT